MGLQVDRRVAEMSTVFVFHFGHELPNRVANGCRIRIGEHGNRYRGIRHGRDCANHAKNCAFGA